MNTSAGLAVDSPVPVAASVSVSSPIDVITQASSLQPPISPFAFYMPPSASTAALSSSILQGKASLSFSVDCVEGAEITHARPLSLLSHLRSSLAYCDLDLARFCVSYPLLPPFLPCTCSAHGTRPKQ